ncbi:hypothetical protein B296_00002305 [Ensete ventricosum]|uniref:non-specific serine/threonine protein kinase n=1 Tax=Ensete ventricosum TaxID=4639 RepID=A0A427AYG3_ENSVE|nr:hypothetical protein B296_00002305 [Ensete ventricosum]
MGNCFSHGTDDKDNPKSPSPPPNTAAAPYQNSATPDVAAHDQPASSSSPPLTPVGLVLGRPMEDVHATYTIGKELGRGQFGVTHLCTHKTTGEQFACKTIAKRKLTSKEDVEDVKREVEIMYHLAGQANVVELTGAYEDKHSVHLVMELCAGGELFDRIISRGHFTEHAAASLLRTIVQIVHTCHSMGVMHRDLKPENFLLLNKEEDSPLKATDFGLSVFFKQGPIQSYSLISFFLCLLLFLFFCIQDIVGSAYYIAPEVLKRKYGPEADIWSIGVMLYILLCGVPPFWAGCLSEEEIKGLKEMFKNMDSDNSGTITLEELKQGLAKQGTKLSEHEVKQLMEAVCVLQRHFNSFWKMQMTKCYIPRYSLMQADADGNGTIDYEEFITATVHMNRMDREEHIYTAFQFFDKDNSG